MSSLVASAAAQVVASEAAGQASVPAWVFGASALGILVGLLIVTMMIKVDR